MSDTYLLSAAERRVFNNISHMQRPDVHLGDRVQAALTLIENGAFLPGSPVNAVTAAGKILCDGVVIHGEKVMTGARVYQFCADQALSVSEGLNALPVDIFEFTTQSGVDLTLDVQPVSGDTLTIGNKVYIFVPVGTDTADGEVSIGASLAEAQDNLVAAINGTDEISDAHPLVVASAFVEDVSTIISKIGGIVGDGITVEATFTAVTNLFSAVALSGGADCLAENAMAALYDAIVADASPVVICEGTVDVNGVDGVQLYAPSSGANGNLIAISVDMANGSVQGDAETLLGGINGTIAIGPTIMADADYLYYCTVANSVSGANWKRIAVGEGF